MSIFGGTQDPGDRDLDDLVNDPEVDLQKVGFSVDEEKVKHAIWKDGFVARWAMMLLLAVTATSLVVIVLNHSDAEANPASTWAMETVKTVAVAFVGFLAGGASASKGA